MVVVVELVLVGIVLVKVGMLMLVIPLMVSSVSIHDQTLSKEYFEAGHAIRGMQRRSAWHYILKILLKNNIFLF